MEKKSIPQSQSSLGFFGTIKKSCKTTSRNGKLLFTILLLVFLSFSQLDFTEKYILGPVSKDFMLQLAKHPNMLQDLTYNTDQTTYVGARNSLREILTVNLLIITISSIISLVFLVATVSSSSEAYTAKVLGLKDIFFKIKESWKRPLDTSFYMVLLSIGIFFLYLISIGITSILLVNSWALNLFYGVITLSIPVCYFYVAALWMVSVVVSVLEEGSSGVKAIWRAVELMKGKKVQASLMMVPYAIAYVVVHVMVNALTTYNLSKSMQLAIAIPFTNGVFCSLKLFMYVMYTVFYHEQKRSHDEKNWKGIYLPIAAGEV